MSDRYNIQSRLYINYLQYLSWVITEDLYQWIDRNRLYSDLIFDEYNIFKTTKTFINHVSTSNEDRGVLTFDSKMSFSWKYRT